MDNIITRTVNTYADASCIAQSVSMQAISKVGLPTCPEEYAPKLTAAQPVHSLLPGSLENLPASQLVHSFKMTEKNSVAPLGIAFLYFPLGQLKQAYVVSGSALSAFSLNFPAGQNVQYSPPGQAVHSFCPALEYFCPLGVPCSEQVESDASESTPALALYRPAGLGVQSPLRT